MIICCILYKAISNKIEQKTGIKYNILQKIMTYVIEQTGCKNIYKILVYIDNLDRSGQISGKIELLQDIQYVILNNSILKPYEAIINKKNIIILEISEEKKLV